MVIASSKVSALIHSFGLNQSSRLNPGGWILAGLNLFWADSFVCELIHGLVEMTKESGRNAHISALQRLQFLFFLNFESILGRFLYA